MPIIYLSPSTQEYNEYVNGLGNEEEWMNRLADAMEPMLFASGIQYTRNTPDMTAASSIRASNAGNYNLHLALHTNASGEDQAGQNRGIIAFYFPGSARGMRAAQFLADGLKAIYPLPNLVRTEPTTTIGEVRRVPGAGGPAGAGVPRQPGRRPMDRHPHRRHGGEHRALPHRIFRHSLLP